MSDNDAASIGDVKKGFQAVAGDIATRMKRDGSNVEMTSGQAAAFRAAIGAESGGGSGDVVGPATSGANRLVQFADGTGKLLKDGPTLGVASAGGVPTRADADARYLLASLLGIANGVMPLGADGKVSTAFLPDAVLGALKWQGAWNATTNNPTIPAAAAGNKGWYFVVNVAGTTSVSGIIDWEIGDWLVSNGASWEKIDNTDQVVSVAGLKGIISVASLLAALGAGVANGLATLNSSGNLPSGQLNLASAATIRAGTSSTTVMGIKNAADAQGFVPVTRAAAAAGMDFSTFFSASITLDANLAMGAPTGGYPEKTGRIRLKQDATGSRTFTPHANCILPIGFAIGTAANSVTEIPYAYETGDKVRFWPPTIWSA